MSFRQEEVVKVSLLYFCIVTLSASSCFILVWVMMNPKPFPWTLSMRWEYTLDCPSQGLRLLLLLETFLAARLQWCMRFVWNLYILKFRVLGTASKLANWDGDPNRVCSNYRKSHSPAPFQGSKSMDLQHELKRFTVESTGMKIITFFSEIWDHGCFQIHAPGEEFKYIGMIFISDGKKERHIVKLIRLVTAVVQLLFWFVKVKKLFVYRSIYIS